MIDWKDDVFSKDNLWHSLGGVAFALVLMTGYWFPWSLVLTVPVSVTAFGLLREQAQSHEEGWRLPFTRLHKLLEGFAWGVGAGIAMTVGLIAWRLS